MTNFPAAILIMCQRLTLYHFRFLEYNKKEVIDQLIFNVQPERKTTARNKSKTLLG